MYAYFNPCSTYTTVYKKNRYMSKASLEFISMAENRLKIMDSIL